MKSIWTYIWIIWLYLYLTAVNITFHIKYIIFIHSVETPTESHCSIALLWLLWLPWDASNVNIAIAIVKVLKEYFTPCYSWISFFIHVNLPTVPFIHVSVCLKSCHITYWSCNRPFRFAKPDISRCWCFFSLYQNSNCLKCCQMLSILKDRSGLRKYLLLMVLL